MMCKNVSNVLYSLIVGIFLFQVNDLSATESFDCEQAFANIINSGDPLDLTDKTHRLERLSDKCKGTGLYEARLAKLYSLNGQADKSLKILRNAIAQDLPHNKELRVTLFDSLFVLERAGEANEVAKNLIKDYPNWDYGYLSAAQVALVERQTGKAIAYLNEASKYGETSNMYLMMVMAYYEEKRYREAAISMQKALKLNKDSLSHTQAVCGAAYSLVALGYLIEADDLLAKHLSVYPDAKNDLTYQEAVATVKEKLREQSGNELKR